MLKDCISLSFVSCIYIYMEEIKSKNVWIPGKLNFPHFCWGVEREQNVKCKCMEAIFLMFRNSDM